MQEYSYLVRRLGEHSLFPEVGGQVTVGLGDGIEGGFSYGQESNIAQHGCRNPLPRTHPRSSKNVGFRKEQGDHSGVSLIYTQNSSFFLSPFTTITLLQTSAIAQIGRFFSINACIKTQFLVIHFHRTSGSPAAGLTCIVKSISRSLRFCLTARSF